MVLLAVFVLGLVLGGLVSTYICRTFKGTDKLELTILKLQNERLTTDLEYHRNMVEQLKSQRRGES